MKYLIDLVTEKRDQAVAERRTYLDKGIDNAIRFLDGSIDAYENVLYMLTTAQDMREATIEIHHMYSAAKDTATDGRYLNIRHGGTAEMGRDEIVAELTKLTESYGYNVKAIKEWSGRCVLCGI
jgi:hypothetical protein